MPTLGRISQKIADLMKLEERLDSEEAKLALLDAADDPSSFVVVKAAEMIGERGGQDFFEPLEKAYRRLLINPLKKDPGCEGKIAIAEALVKLEYRDLDFFRTGIKYEQLEPVFEDPAFNKTGDPRFNGKQDTAAQLRSECAAGLVGCASLSEALLHIAELLADPWKPARIGAARALAALSSMDCVPLLRLKLLMGDIDSEVMGECCTALLSLQRDDAIDFVADLMTTDNPDVFVQVAYALGLSRNSKAFEPLYDYWQRKRHVSTRSMLMTCMALLRSNEANAFLLSLIRSNEEPAASDAISALAPHRFDKKLCDSVAAAVEEAANPELRTLFKKEFRVGE